MDLLFACILLIALGFAATRLPGLGRKRNQAIATCGVALSIGLALMISPIYNLIDGMFERTNFTDLFAKLALFFAVNILGNQLARGLRDKRALSKIGGFQGRLVFVFAFVVEMVLFAFTNTPRSSPGLELYQTDPLVIGYTGVAVGYIAYVCSCLLPPLTAQFTDNQSKLSRAAAGLLIAGFSLVIVRTVLVFVGIPYPGIYDFAQGISLLSTLCVIAGLAIAWRSLRVHGEPLVRQSALRDED
ncbi:hypothetical protein [Arthrobacter sp. B1805]|uniref:hypothetical protein n=1 Tax=Arthrobacter sp. B1805 TaxID=2058892 RepID=UPI000CE3D68F|nr:hypothetical protein [Arthrobacter sp. B1805]